MFLNIYAFIDIYCTINSVCLCILLLHPFCQISKVLTHPRRSIRINSSNYFPQIIRLYFRVILIETIYSWHVKSGVFINVLCTSINIMRIPCLYCFWRKEKVFFFSLQALGPRPVTPPATTAREKRIGYECYGVCLV